jgi:hypothetical protein
MHQIEDRQTNKHQTSIKDIQEDLVRENEPRVPLCIFHDAHYASNHDQTAGSNQNIEMLLPRLAWRGGKWCWVFTYANEEDEGDDHEHAESEDLNEEST